MTHPDHYLFSNAAAHRDRGLAETDSTEKLFGLRRSAFQPTALTFRGKELGPVSDYYFDPPGDAVGKFNGLLNELRPGTDWRTPRVAASAGAWPEGEALEVIDGGTQVCFENYPGLGKVELRYGGQERIAHNALFSASFYLHPFYGTGHVLRTDGRVAAFWNGEGTYVVHFTNLRALRVRLDAPNEHVVRAGRKGKAKLTRQELLDLI